MSLFDSQSEDRTGFGARRKKSLAPDSFRAKEIPFFFFGILHHSNGFVFIFNFLFFGFWILHNFVFQARMAEAETQAESAVRAAEAAEAQAKEREMAAITAESAASEAVKEARAKEAESSALMESALVCMRVCIRKRSSSSSLLSCRRFPSFFFFFFRLLGVMFHLVYRESCFTFLCYSHAVLSV